MDFLHSFYSFLIQACKLFTAFDTLSKLRRNWKTGRFLRNDINKIIVSGA